jgi:hypothetical protein
MSSAHPDPAPLDRALRRTHRSTLLGLAACALVSFLQPGESESTPPPSLYTLIAVALATATIATRQLATSPRLAARVRVMLSLTALALATAIGLLGAYLAVAVGSRQAGLLFILAAAIFSLRPPPPAVPPERRR